MENGEQVCRDIERDSKIFKREKKNMVKPSLTTFPHFFFILQSFLEMSDDGTRVDKAPRFFGERTEPDKFFNNTYVTPARPLQISHIFVLSLVDSSYH
jgi:hypothetical protein